MRWYFERDIPNNATDCITQANEGEVLLKRIGAGGKEYVAVSFRIGSLLYTAEQFQKANAVYRRALRAKKLGASQRGSLWINIGQASQQLGKNSEALLAFRNAQKDSKYLNSEERATIAEWISHHELRSGNVQISRSRTEKVIEAVRSGVYSESLASEAQWVYENYPLLSKRLTATIAKRVAEGDSLSDFELFNVAISSDHRLDRGINPVIFGEFEVGIGKRMSKGDLSAEALLAKSQWMQGKFASARTDTDRKNNLEALAAQVRLLLKGRFDADQSEYGRILVHVLEAEASSSDAKAQALIKEALVNLKGRSIVDNPKPVEHNSAPAIIFASCSTLSLTGITFLYLRRRKRISSHA